MLRLRSRPSATPPIWRRARACPLRFWATSPRASRSRWRTATWLRRTAGQPTWSTIAAATPSIGSSACPCTAHDRSRRGPRRRQGGAKLFREGSRRGSGYGVIATRVLQSLTARRPNAAWRTWPMHSDEPSPRVTSTPSLRPARRWSRCCARQPDAASHPTT